MDIDIQIFKFSHQELIDLKAKQDEKLERYLKCYNECTERTLLFILTIDEEISRRKKEEERKEKIEKIKSYVHYCNYMEG